MRWIRGSGEDGGGAVLTVVVALAAFERRRRRSSQKTQKKPMKEKAERFASASFSCLSFRVFCAPFCAFCVQKFLTTARLPKVP
jgi:uncharacterized protein (TIGR03382 family)